MELPKQIQEFGDKVLNGLHEVKAMIANYNDLEVKKEKIIAISKEYLKVQPLSTDEVRAFLVEGIEVAQKRLKLSVQDKIKEIYKYDCAYPDGVD